jgi:hypothetical protein
MRGETDGIFLDCVPEIDFSYGYRFFLGNMANYSKALMSLLKSIKSKLPILHTMSITEEYEGLRTITQTLRKMLGNIGALGIAEETYQLETVLLNEADSSLQLELKGYINTLVELSNHLELLLKKLDLQGTPHGDDKNPNFLNYDFTKTKESIKLSADYLERKIL